MIYRIAARRGRAWPVLAGAGLALLPLAALAEESADTATLDEIVVTAQKRAETLTDVPLSVEAVSGDKLAEAGIQRLDDLKAYVPNLQMTETGIANNIYIRGIGSGLNQGFEQSVSLYADGIYRGRGHQSRMPFLDLARVEVLRGPQPTLFGKNAVAGAVNLVSAQPTSTAEGHVRLSYDTEQHDTVADAVISGPISPGLLNGRLALRSRQADGYINNLTLGRMEPKRDDLSGRLTLANDADSKLNWSLRIESGNFRTKGRQIEIFDETPSAPPYITGLTYSQAISGSPLPLLGYPAGLPQGTSATAADNVLNYQRSSNGDTSNLTPSEFALTINYGLASGITLTSLTGYSTYKLDETCDCDFTGATVFEAGIGERYSQFSQEFRLTSPKGDKFQWIAGAFYQRYSLSESDYLHVPPNSLVIPVLAARFNPIIAAAVNDAVNPRDFAQTSKQSSAFAQGTWSFAEHLRATLGARYTKENKTGSRVTTLTTGFGGPAITNPLYLIVINQLLGIIPHNIAGERSESGVSPLANLQWDFAANSMAYVSAAKASKAGGFDARSNKPPVVGGNPTNSGTFEFKDEKATTYEIGVKSRIADRAEINADIYYTDYKDLQTSAFDGAIGFTVGNGSATVKGLELEGRFQVTPRFRLSGTLATLHFEWTSYFGQCAFGVTPLTVAQDPVNAGNCDHKGEDNQLAPKLTGMIGADFNWPLSNGLQLRANVDAVYSSSYLLSLTLDPYTTQGAYTKFNARMSLTNPDNHWELAVIGRNLADKQTLSYAGDTPLANRLFGARSYYGFVDPPRSIAIEAALHF
jgi:outer membrane receptor protein involved in Fe transport